MRYKVYHNDYPEDARECPTLAAAKHRAWCMDHEVKFGKRERTGCYHDIRAGITIEPIKK
jgi:hypothetical protein